MMSPIEVSKVAYRSPGPSLMTIFVSFWGFFFERAGAACAMPATARVAAARAAIRLCFIFPRSHEASAGATTQPGARRAHDERVLAARGLLEQLVRPGRT